MVESLFDRLINGRAVNVLHSSVRNNANLSNY